MLNDEALSLLRALKEDRGVSVCFDSGGYYVQVGRVQYHELYLALLRKYREHPWADWYILPDHVPTSQDRPEVVTEKVRETVSFSTLFLSELPKQLQVRAVPVVHGHTPGQIEYCLERYLRLGVRALGFGSFATVGRGGEANMTTEQSLANVRLIVEVARERNIRVHLFGVGAPSLVPLLSGLGAKSFDSSSWIKAAGFGQVYLPFTRGYNVTYVSGRSTVQKAITWDRLSELKRITQHTCAYCNDYSTLVASKMHRAIHNLICITEAVDHINNGHFDLIRRIYQNGSPKYREAGVAWLPSS